MENKKQRACGNNPKKVCKTRPAVALLIMLFMIMAITALTLGYLARSDVELASATNIELKTELDYLAESGLEHARGLLLNSKGVDTNATGYWTGGTAQQLLTGDDYYDINIGFRCVMPGSP